MPYTPQLPPVLLGTHTSPETNAGSPFGDGAVTPVTQVTALLQTIRSRLEIEKKEISIQITTFDQPLWFAPGVAEVERLVGQGISRGRIWTAAEITQVLGGADLEPDDIASLMRTKYLFDGVLLSVQPDEAKREERPAHRAPVRSSAKSNPMRYGDTGKQASLALVTSSARWRE